MKPDQIAGFRHLAALWVTGSFCLSLLTWLCLGLGLNFATTAFAYLIVVVLLSLLDSFVSSAVFSAIAIACLNYFFVEPRFTFQVNYAEDLAALAAFLITSLVVTGLVRRLRDLGNAQREQAQLLDLTTDAVFARDSNDVITYWNRGAQELYGWRRDEAVGRLSHDLLQTVFPARLADINERLSQTGRWEGEAVHTARDGRKVTVASRWSRQQDARGNSIGTLESHTDITERKRAEEALHRSQAGYLAEAQKLSLTGSFGWNVSSGELFWSEESFRIFGYDPGTKPTVEAALARVHPEDASLVRQVIERAARDRQDLDFEHRLLFPDGSIKHLHVVAHAATDEPDKLQFVGAVMDVTARKRTEEALRYSEHRYTNLFQAMAASFWELDFSGVDAMLRGLRKSGVTDIQAYLREHPGFVRDMMRRTRVVDVNDQTVAMFGRGDKAELLGNVEPFWPEESTQAYADGVLAGIARKHSFSVECKLRRIDGSLFDALFTSAYPPDTMGRGSLMVGVIDITERVRAQDTLQRVQADFAHAARVSMLGELTASIAHEVNQPLAAIATNGEAGLRWLSRPDPELAEVSEIVGEIVADARRASDIIARVRTMATRHASAKAVLSLDDVIREALLFLRHEIQARAVSVLHRPAPGAPRVLADRTQLQQVIVNLAVNAMQAMASAEGRERRIAIQTVVTGGTTLHCTVEDSGPGLSPEHVGQLFDSFFTTKESGMGMGLPICRSIIEAHGGRIAADNQSAAGGARFSFTLPAADTASRTTH